jgi:hypothetical protein
MTLEDLIKYYESKNYKIWKPNDKDGKPIKTYFIFEKHSDYLEKYLGFYKKLPNLTEVIVHASDGIFKLTNNGIEYFIRHNHQELFFDQTGAQRGVPYEVTKKVRNNLIIRINDLLKARTFDEIVKIVSECKERGFGELSIYDTALRIGSYLNIEPDKVYLHAGARQGAAILEQKGYLLPGSNQRSWLKVEEIPKAMQVLKPKETEHFLCAMKFAMSNLDAAKASDLL